LFQTKNLAKGCAGKTGIWETKIWMIKDIEELETYSQRPSLPSGKFRALHDAEIGIEIAGSAKMVAALRESHRGPTARARDAWEIPSVEPGDTG
jgi:hypothetical protein